MKRPSWIFLLLLTTSPLFISCLSNQDEVKWRDDNIAFMRAVAKKPGILQLGDSLNGYPGIYYEIIASGDSASSRPVIGDVVTVSYKGWLYNDTTSFDSKDNYQFTVGKSVIDGWSLVLQYMHIGDIWKVYIPYYLGYGTSDYGKIPAYSTLIFQIHLKKIEPK
jgi:FKBP-type peptidyl-prolyl cis-trans isomerase